MNEREAKKHLKELASQLVKDKDKLKSFAAKWRVMPYHYSLFNSIMLMIQHGSGSLFANKSKWAQKNRQPKDNARKYYVLVPSAPKVRNENPKVGKYKWRDPLTDEEKKRARIFFNWRLGPIPIEDTEGEDLNIGAQDMINGDAPVTFEQAVEAFKGDFEIRVGYNGEAGGYATTIGDKHIIRITPRKQEAMLHTLFHEIAHHWLGHTERKHDWFTPQMKEVQAEATAYVACSMVGIESDSSKFYIGHWGGEEAESIIDKSSIYILQSAERIVKRLIRRTKDDTMESE